MCVLPHVAIEYWLAIRWWWRWWWRQRRSYINRNKPFLPINNMILSCVGDVIKNVTFYLFTYIYNNMHVTIYYKKCIIIIIEFLGRFVSSCCFYYSFRTGLLLNCCDVISVAWHIGSYSIALVMMKIEKVLRPLNSENH